MKKCSTLLLLATIASITLTGCADQEAAPGTTQTSDKANHIDTTVSKDNTDPRKGWVVVIDVTGYPATSGGPYQNITMIKRCDNTTLLYVTPGANSGAHGITAIELSPECRAQS